MFVKEAVHNNVIAERDQLQEENNRLNTQVEENTQTISDLQNQNETLTTENERLTSELETANTNAQQTTSDLETANARITEMEIENEQLRQLPGAESAIIVSSQENGNTGNQSELDRVNDICKKGGDLNERINAVSELNL